MSEQVILVNSKDEPIGTMEKLKAHEEGLLHRAFSVFIFNSKGQLLLQRRALHKYHSAGLWTNTCCSHPRPGESTLEAANRRLKEEMGIDCELKHEMEFIYKAPFDNGLIEHEYDHVFIGHTDFIPTINPNEVAEFKYIEVAPLRRDIHNNPHEYTAWFKIIMDKITLF